MLFRNQTSDKMASRTEDILADLHDRFVSYKEPSRKYNFLSPTSTLSSGYQSGCAESEIDEMLYSGHQTDDCEYFELESDQYVCLDGQSDDNNDEKDKIQQVRDSMIKIITDLESLGYETSLDKLSEAVRSSVKQCSKSVKSSSKRKTRASSLGCLHNNNNNNVYTKSPVDQLFTEIKHQTLDAGSKEKLYDSLITNLAIECSSSSSDCADEPIYEEIHDDSDFDFVSHSDTYRKPSAPPALPPRKNHAQSLSRHSSYTPSHRRDSSCLTEVQKVTWNSQCRKSSTWQAMSV